MYSLNQVNKLVSCGRDPARSLPLWRGFLLIPLVLVCFAFAPQTRAVIPVPDGCYPGFNTAEGCQALQNGAGTTANTALGWRALFSDTTGGFNAGVGAAALVLNNADANTAVGTATLLLNGEGSRNTAVGAAAMVFNTGNTLTTEGFYNCAVGAFALNQNQLGFSNEAIGDSALFFNINGAANVAVGDLALEQNDASGVGSANFNVAVGAQALNANILGDSNNAVGASALQANVDGLFNQAFGAFALSAALHGASNIAIGDSALLNHTGASGSGFNTVIGDLAGSDLTDGSDNIYIGATAGAGVTTESGTIRIGDPMFVSTCFVAGITGVPVTGVPVVVDANGQLGVAAAGSPLSMNEVLKERQVVQQLKTTTEKQAARIALQEEQINTLTAALKQQADQIQKVSAQLEMVRPAPRVVNNQ
jgi:hypothetical protein